MSHSHTLTDSWIRQIPKAELHLHIEGTLEPEMMFALAGRNGVKLPYLSPEAVKKAYEFENLQSFLDLYYAATAVLLTQQDFYDLTHAYFVRVAAEGVRHAEIFFDPQTHTQRGVAFETVLDGISQAMADAKRDLGVTSHLIMCFLRDLPVESAMATLEQALPYKDRIVGVGLDSAERDYPPRLFVPVFDRARQEGFKTVAHAGEEGPAAYVWEALDLLHVSRIDHGVRSVEDPRLIERLVREQVPLTVCPLSNVRLCVFPRLADHNLRQLLHQGVKVTVNSDDPAYFGGYVSDNLVACREALDLSAKDIVRLVKNSFEASFLDSATCQSYLDAVDRFVAEHQLTGAEA